MHTLWLTRYNNSQSVQKNRIQYGQNTNQKAKSKKGLKKHYGMPQIQLRGSVESSRIQARGVEPRVPEIHQR